MTGTDILLVWVGFVVLGVGYLIVNRLAQIQKILESKDRGKTQ